MSHLPDNERLLKEVLAEDSGDGFREALLADTLRRARARRTQRKAQRIGGGGLVVAAIAWLIWPQQPRPLPPEPASAISPAYQLVRTQPMPTTMVVASQPFANEQYVQTVAAANVISTTATSGAFRLITDDELLALAPEPAALVRRGPHLAELVFVGAATDEAPTE
jgi:hypothetical protein